MFESVDNLTPFLAARAYLTTSINGAVEQVRVGVFWGKLTLSKCSFGGNMFIRNFESQTYAIMRIMVGFLFFWHGMQKLFGIPSAAADLPPFVTYGAGGIELLGGVLVAIGLFTRPAAFLASGLMAAAYWMAHGFNALLPFENQGELAALYCFVFLYISARGAGLWSVDAARGDA